MHDGDPGLVVVPPCMTKDNTGSEAGKFKPLTDDQVAAYSHDAHRVAAPAGSLVLWRRDAVHGNAGHGNTLPTYKAPVYLTFDDVLATPSRAHDCVEQHGTCVMTGVLSPEEAAAFVAAQIEAISACRTRPDDLGVKPKGPAGCGLWKSYGPSNHEAIQPFMVHPNVIAVWAAILGTDDICFSPDALAFSMDPATGYDPTRPVRATLIQCFGRSSDQKPGTGARKLARMMAGKSCNHQPTECTNGGGGDHMSNRLVLRPDGSLSKDWKPIRPATVDPRVIKYLGP